MCTYNPAPHQATAPYPANMRRWPNVGLQLGQRRRRWANCKPTLGQRLMFAGYTFSLCWFNVGPAAQTVDHRVKCHAGWVMTETEILWKIGVDMSQKDSPFLFGRSPGNRRINMIIFGL